MFRDKWLIALLALAPSLGLAGQMGKTATDNFSGAYIGLGMGFQSPVFHQKVYVTSTGVDNESTSRGANGFAVQGIVGYQNLFSNHWLIGGEFNYTHNLSDARDDKHYLATVTRTDNKAQENFGLALRVGYATSNWNVLFADVGPQWANAEHSTVSGNVRSNKDKTNMGWRVGAGAEQALTSRWHVREHLSYADFGSYNVTHDNDSTQKMDVTMVSGMIDVLYRF
jgi:outer membrane immunogenic protein